MILFNNLFALFAHDRTLNRAMLFIASRAYTGLMTAFTVPTI